jgi:lipopolysaccharide biosynthesis glycosyltransferase
MLKVFIGYDHRQPVAYNVLQHSIIKNASVPVSITPLVYHQLPIHRDDHWRGANIKNKGLTPFTYSRFLVPYLSNYEGVSLFLDIDIVVLDDIKKLFDLADPNFALQVVKNEKRFEWASVMLFNNEKCKILTPDYIDDLNNNGLHQIKWLKEEDVGALPTEWNHLVGYDKPRPDAKLIHYTQGLPCYEETIMCEYSAAWHEEHKIINSALSWQELMGNSVHAAVLPNGRLVPKLSVNQ